MLECAVITLKTLWCYLSSCPENNTVSYEITEQSNVCALSNTVVAVSILSGFLKPEKHLECHCGNSLKVT